MKIAPHLTDRAPRGSIAGRLALRLYHRPVACWREASSAGWGSWIATNWGQRAMKAAARRLPVLSGLPPLAGQRAPVVFLTGTQYWWETAFCAHSLARQLRAMPKLVFVSDGTLRNTESAVLRQQFPSARFVSAAEVEAVLSARFNPAQYPLLWYYRAHKPILRKLTDVFGHSGEWQLLLDSDMLFLDVPDEIVEWLRQPDEFLGMRDVKTAYGYSTTLLETLAEGPLPDRLNIGVFGMAGKELDWHFIERAMQELLEREGLHYNLCQGLSAIVYARTRYRILPASKYLLLPDRNETLTPTATMHHYVAESKEWYRRWAWRKYAHAART